MKAVTTLLLAAALVLTPACNRTPVLDSRVDDILNPVVGILIDGNDAGSGVVVAHDEQTGETLILTAKHVASPFPTVVITQGEDGEVVATAEAPKMAVRVFDHEAKSVEDFPAEVVKLSPSTDLALLKAKFTPKAIAKLWQGDSRPATFSPSYTCGMSAWHVPMANRGEITCDPLEVLLSSSHANWGYSGGGLFVEQDGEWRLVGIVVQIGVIKGWGGEPFPVFHASLAVPFNLIREFLSQE